MTSGIYKILNKENGKFYIGSAKSVNTRTYDHFCALKYNRHKNIHLQRAWNNYWFPEEIFEFIILEYCENYKLIEREQFYLDTLIPEYNINRIAGNMLGFKHSEKTKNKLSQISKAKGISKETGVKISEALRGRTQSISERASRMKIDKWPHGWNCKCEKCKSLRNLYQRLRRNGYDTKTI